MSCRDPCQAGRTHHPSPVRLTCCQESEATEVLKCRQPCGVSSDLFVLLRTIVISPTDGLVSRSARRLNRRASAILLLTKLSASFMSPKTIAWAGHDCWQAVLMVPSATLLPFFFASIFCS